MPENTHSPLNRLSWLRPFPSFLNTIIEIPKTRWLLFNNSKPLIVHSDNDSTFSLAYLTTQDVEHLLGPRPYFGQGKELGHSVLSDTEPKYVNQSSTTESARHRGLRVVFLGLHETGEPNVLSLPSSDFTDPVTTVQNLEGTSYFSFDISNAGLTDEELQHFLRNTTLGQNGDNLMWSKAHPIMLLDAFTVSIFALARSMVDWNQRNKFCPGCGSPSYSMWGGWKIACSSLLPWAEPTDKQCFTAKGLHNFMYPRTDAVVMMIAIDETYDKILLGRGRIYPGKYYSACAGFVEPGESLENAVARESLEETGVHVWDAKLHSGYPWPFPAGLLIGFYARGDSTKPIRVDLDKELIDARWFTRQEIRSVLDHPNGSLDLKDYQQKKTERFGEKKNNVQPVSEQSDSVATSGMASNSGQAVQGNVADKPPFQVPPVQSLAGVLIRDWIEGKIGFHPEGRQQGVFKGNL